VNEIELKNRFFSSSANIGSSPDVENDLLYWLKRLGLSGRRYIRGYAVS